MDCILGWRFLVTFAFREKDCHFEQNCPRGLSRKPVKTVIIII